MMPFRFDGAGERCRHSDPSGHREVRDRAGVAGPHHGAADSEARMIIEGRTIKTIEEMLEFCKAAVGSERGCAASSRRHARAEYPKGQ